MHQQNTNTTPLQSLNPGGTTSTLCCKVDSTRSATSFYEGPTMPNEPRPPASASSTPLQRIARPILILGAVAALALTLYTGRNNHSVLLVAMFAVWVLSPFAGFLFAARLAQRTRRGIAAVIPASAIIVTICSVAIYAAIAFSPHRPTTAFAFLAVPAASWLALGPLLIAARFSRSK